ncbi:MAG: response regulator [bacterium]|nr:response regulator [bacterium]
MQDRLKVLFVDDDPNIRELVKYNLTLEGLEVTLAENGCVGLELIGKETFDLILLDVMMPEMDGLQVLSAIKNDGKTAELPVFMLTAKGMVADMERAFKIGADDYITKPFDPVDLGDVIRRKLKRLSDDRK